MSSYLENLKKGMELDEETQETPEETVELVSENIVETDEGIQIEKVETPVKAKKKAAPKKKPVVKKKTTPKKKPSQKKKPELKKEEPLPEMVFEEPKALEKEKETILIASKKEDKWTKPEGELAVDIYQTEKNIIIRSAIAGVKMTDISIVLEGDMLIIRGERKRPKDSEEIKDSFCQECHWGAFSKKIILPVSIDEDHIDATIKDGILELKMKIINRSGQKEIKIKKA
jgi:HSP20 family protein